MFQLSGQRGRVSDILDCVQVCLRPSQNIEYNYSLSMYKIWGLYSYGNTPIEI